MRLLLADSVPLTYGGGYERFLLSFGRIAAQRGHDVLLVTTPREMPGGLKASIGIGKADSLSEAVVAEEAHPARVSVTGLREAKSLAAGADVLYVKNEPHELAMACLLRGHRAKMVVGFHSATEGRSGVGGRLRARAYRSRAYQRLAGRAVAFHVLQPHQARFLVRRLSIPSSRIWLIPNGVDLQRFVPLPRSIPDRAFRILFVGRLDEQKGIDVLLKSLSMIRPKDVTIAVTVAGEGPMKSVVESMAARMPYLTFVGYKADPARLYASHDLLVAPSRWEVFPLVPCEALACGLPLVLSDIPANSVFRTTNATAVCQVDDAESLAAVVRERIDLWQHDPDEYEGLRTSARRFALEHLDQRLRLASLVANLEGIA